jgi:hypothetical protein
MISRLDLTRIDNNNNIEMMREETYGCGIRAAWGLAKGCKGWMSA